MTLLSVFTLKRPRKEEINSIKKVETICDLANAQWILMFYTQAIQRIKVFANYRRICLKILIQLKLV